MNLNTDCILRRTSVISFNATNINDVISASYSSISMEYNLDNVDILAASSLLFAPDCVLRRTSVSTVLWLISVSATNINDVISARYSTYVVSRWNSDHP